MAADPYSTLGVSRSATPDEIRRAYRRAAKESHPDLNPGNKAAEDRFKAINTANDLLSDTDKRARYDRGEIDEAGDPKYQAPPGYSQHAQGPRGFRYGSGPFGNAGGFGADAVDPSEYEELFADFLRQGGQPGGQPGSQSGGQSGGQNRRAQRPRRGQNRTYTLDIDFLDAINGASQRLTLPGGGTLDIRIPAGIETGQTLRLKEKGDPGQNGAPPGDALIDIAVRPHPHFVRDGNDLLLTLSVTLTELVLGAKVPVTTPTGTVSLSIPPHSANGSRMRLRGRGVPAHGGQPAGDQYVILALVLDPQDAGLAEFLRTRTDAPDFDPR